MKVIRNNFFKLELNEKTGAIDSFTNAKGKEFISFSRTRDLFAFTVIDNDEFSVISANTAQKVFFEEKENLLRVCYEGIGGEDLSAQVSVRYEENSPFTFWSIAVQNKSKYHLDKIDFPKVVVPNDLIATGGTGRIFTSMMEGLLVEDAEIRATFKNITDTDNLATGWGGKYPGACATQFSAYYCDEGGLYFAAHDKECNPKIIEYYQQDGGIKLEFKLYPGVDDTSDFRIGYEMVLGVFDGDWYDAAEIYRDFVERSGIIKIPKLKENENIPEWLKTDPVIVCYPVRGQVDGEIDENSTEEYYPYTKGVPYMRELRKSLDSPVMPLLMHWEGTAPWAPPYVWPPYGDFADFKEYIKTLHADGNYIGVYCSGISWTDQSLLVPSYNKEKEFKERNWKDAICVLPDQTSDYTWKGIRYSYELCPACRQTKDAAVKEFEKIITGCDVDYVQFFDQNLGGAAYACYGKKHGHCFGPGKWKNEEMLKIADGMLEVLKANGKEDKVVIGCEGNAAEPFVNSFIFNDSRHNINYQYGNPVSAYNYIFHEYVCNFMGNQNTQHRTVDYEKYPDNIYMRYAHSFAQGDILTVVLKNKGQIHWDWCTPWNAPEIDQKQIREYVGNLNRWRKNIAKDALLYGRMTKPVPYDCGIYEEAVKYGGKLVYRSIESACYTVDGKKQQIFVNFLPFAQKMKIHSEKAFRLIKDAFGKEVEPFGGESEIEIPARSVVMAEFDCSEE